MSQFITESKVSSQAAEIKEVQNKSIDIYPNPASSYFIVYDYSTDQNRMIELIDMNGKAIKRQAASTMVTRIETGQLTNGLYILRIKDAKGKVIRTEKILIQR
jgi:hypothetical protein